MAIADRFTGKDFYARFIHSGGTVALTGDHTEFSVEVSYDTTEITAGSETAKSYLTTLEDATMSLTLFNTGTTGSALAVALEPGTYGTLEWGPQGTASGKPKFGCAAYVTGFSESYPFADSVQREYSFQRSGDWVSNYGTVVW